MTVEPTSILLVDDDQAIREALAELLGDEGFIVHLAKNGAEALTWLRANDPPAVVLLDLMMPVMDGREFLRLRKDHPSVARIPVLVITADRASSDLNADPAVEGLVSKPIVVDDLLGAIGRVVQDPLAATSLGSGNHQGLPVVADET
jgi:two-component system, chemotaxis family, chemotaxis protein CheY